MSKKRKPAARRKLITASTGPSPGLYASDATFRALIDEWVRVRRCPLILVDRCYELDLPNQADCARWAAAQPDKWCGTDEHGKEIQCGTYPCKHQKNFYLVTDNINATSAYGVPLARMGREVSYATERFKSALNGVLWLLDNWIADPNPPLPTMAPLAKRPRKKRKTTKTIKTSEKKVVPKRAPRKKT